MDSQPATIIEKIRAYQACYADVAKALHPELEKAMAEAGQTRQHIHKEVRHRYHGKTYICAISAMALKAQGILFQITPARSYFEVVAYDPDKKLYYYYEDHFFKRYAQRMKIWNWPFADILQHYIRHNPVMVSDMHKYPAAVSCHFIAMVNMGMIHPRKEGANVVVFSALISRFTMTGKQLKETRKLRLRLHRKSATQGAGSLKRTAMKKG